MTMGRPAAKQGDRITGQDVHVVVVPGTPPVTVPLPHPFTGVLNGGLSTDVRIEGHAAAVVGSTADNLPPHVPAPPGAAFQRPPSNTATVLAGSATVRINGRAAARAGDPAVSCNDPVDAPTCTVAATGTVSLG
jgi:uncharacterized Zn-binding protein involved in type VI secretion